MAKVYTWHLTCETHGIDEWASCQTTGNDAEVAQQFIETAAAKIQAEHQCQRTFANLVELTEEVEL